MIKTKILENGLKLIVDEMPAFESVAFNMLVHTGSANEDKSNYGISHFIEHMLFKGTKNRSAFDISKTFDTLGANVNAYTNFEETNFYVTSVAENTEKCVEVMADMLFNSTFEKPLMENEKMVVIEEIKMYDDDPVSKASAISNKAFYKGTPFERDIAGTIKNVKSITQKKIFDYLKKHYVPQNITLSFAGKISFEDALNLVEKYFMPYFINVGVKTNNRFEKTKNVSFVKSYKDNSQSIVVISFPGLYQTDKEIHIAKILNTALGVGMSSILFQKVRFEKALVYSISSSVFSNTAGGDISIDFATSTKNVVSALEAVKDVIKNLLKNGITKEQFLNAKANVINSLKLAFESTSAVAQFNASKFGKLSETVTKEQYIKQVDDVKFDDIQNFIKTHFVDDFYCVAVVGKDRRTDFKKHFSLND